MKEKIIRQITLSQEEFMNMLGQQGMLEEVVFIDGEVVITIMESCNTRSRKD